MKRFCGCLGLTLLLFSFGCKRIEVGANWTTKTTILDFDGSPRAVIDKAATIFEPHCSNASGSLTKIER